MSTLMDGLLYSALEGTQDGKENQSIFFLGENLVYVSNLWDWRRVVGKEIRQLVRFDLVVLWTSFLKRVWVSFTVNMNSNLSRNYETCPAPHPNLVLVQSTPCMIHSESESVFYVLTHSTILYILYYHIF